MLDDILNFLLSAAIFAALLIYHILYTIKNCLVFKHARN